MGKEEACYVLKEIHEECCGNHLGNMALTENTFSWPTMKTDAMNIVRTCKSCQRRANLQGQPVELMWAVASPRPFDLWRVGIVEPFPVPTGQRKFLLVPIDYFSKWVEAELLARIMEREVLNFLWKNIVCRFGIPRRLVSDNGRQICDGKVQAWCREMKIEQVFISVANPQSNGQVEVTNKSGRLKEDGWTNSRAYCVLTEPHKRSGQVKPRTTRSTARTRVTP